MAAGTVAREGRGFNCSEGSGRALSLETANSARRRLRRRRAKQIHRHWRRRGCRNSSPTVGGVHTGEPSIRSPQFTVTENCPGILLQYWQRREQSRHQVFACQVFITGNCLCTHRTTTGERERSAVEQFRCSAGDVKRREHCPVRTAQSSQSNELRVSLTPGKTSSR